MDKLPKEKLYSQTTAGARFDYENRCLETLETALGRTPIYESWKAFDPGVRHDVDTRYNSLPVLTKDDIRAHFPHGVVPMGLDLDAALARGEVSIVSTSGTADEALENIWNQQWWNDSERASWKLNRIAARVATGTHPEAILASALSVGPRSEGGPIDREHRMLGRFLFLNEFGTTAEWPEGHERRILAELADYQPVVLEANPSLIARLARFAWKHGGGGLPAATHYPYLRVSLCTPVARHPAGILLADSQLVWLHRGRLRVHGVRAWHAPPEYGVLPRGFCPSWGQGGDPCRCGPHLCHYLRKSMVPPCAIRHR